MIKKILIALACSTLMVSQVWAQDAKGGNPPGPKGGPGKGNAVHHNNPPGPKGGPGHGEKTHRENPPGPKGGPGVGQHFDGNPPGPKGGPGDGQRPGRAIEKRQEHIDDFRENHPNAGRALEMREQRLEEFKANHPNLSDEEAAERFRKMRRDHPRPGGQGMQEGDEHPPMPPRRDRDEMDRPGQIQERRQERFEDLKAKHPDMSDEEIRAKMMERRDNIRERRENMLDRRKDIRDRQEDVLDRREDIRDHREDLRDARHEGGPRDKMEDRMDRREDRRDRREDRRDRREDRIDHRPEPGQKDFHKGNPPGPKGGPGKGGGKKVDKPRGPKGGPGAGARPAGGPRR